MPNEVNNSNIPTLGIGDTHAIRGELDEVKCIAKGGMAYIFRARQPSLNRYIVVKKLKDEYMSSPEMVERFRREAKSLASVLHQNVAHVYDFVDGNRESYIVMEYIDGIDLSTVLSKVGDIPPRIAACILLGVARGVSYIHAHNLIHRDIKPSNIRITKRGLVKLMDFGIVMDIENSSLTRPGMMVGSPSYLSPEQVLADAITPRSDLFLLGIVLYEMLTGTKPFKEEDGKTIFQQIRAGQYIPPRQMQSKIPKSLARIVQRCLQKDPDKRYPNIMELVTAIEEFLGPKISARIEDLIIEYLDSEALLDAAGQFEKVKEKRSFLLGESVSWKVLALILFLVGAGLGFWLGSGHFWFRINFH